MAVLPFTTPFFADRAPDDTGEHRAVLVDGHESDDDLSKQSFASMHEHSTSCSASFSDQKALLEHRIHLLVDQGGESHPLLAGSYLELGHLLVGKAAQSVSQRGTLQEAEGEFLRARDVAVVSGDVETRIASLQELSLIADMLGDRESAISRGEEATRLHQLAQERDQIPFEERLRYDHPAVPSMLSLGEQKEFKRAIERVIEEALNAAA